MLEVDRARRTIGGRAIPWNVAVLLNRRRIALVKDSLTWSSTVPILLRHNHSLIVGRVVSLVSAEDGLWVQLRVSNGERGDKAFAVVEAGWGLSIGWTTITDEVRSNVEWVTLGEITEISLVPKPAFGPPIS